MHLLMQVDRVGSSYRQIRITLIGWFLVRMIEFFASFVPL